MWQDQPMGTAIGITMDTTTATQFRFLRRMGMRTTASRLRPIYIHPGRYTPPRRSVQHQWFQRPHTASVPDIGADPAIGAAMDMGGAKTSFAKHSPTMLLALFRGA